AGPDRDAAAGVEAAAALFPAPPAGTETARAHLAFPLEPAASEHDRLGFDDLFDTVGENANSFDAGPAAQDRGGACTIANVDAVFRGGLVFGLDEACAATVRVDHHAAKEFKAACVVVGLASE